MADTENPNVTTEEITEKIEIQYKEYTLMPQKNNENMRLGITNVRMGSGAPVCDIELNEIQELMQQQLNCYDSIVRSMFNIDVNKNIVFIGDKSATMNSDHLCQLQKQMFACVGGKIFELKPSFYVPSLINQGNIYAVFSYDNLIGAINAENNIPAKLYEYGYKGSYSSYEDYKGGRWLGGEEITTIDADTYLYNWSNENNKSIVEGAPGGVETSKRCGFTYIIITSAEKPKPEDEEIVLCLGEYKDGIVTFGGEDAIVTSSIEYNLAHHLHKDFQYIIDANNWIGNTAPYSLSVNFSDINTNLPNYNIERPIISLIPVGATTEDKIQELDSYASISEVTVENNALTFICYENKPTTNLTINLKVV